MDFVISVAIVFVPLYFAAILWIYWTRWLGAPWVPTPLRKVRKMLVMAQVRSGDLVYDLGAGDGRMVILAARDYGARAVGVEVDPLRCLLIWLAVRILGLSARVRVVRGDFFKQDLAAADVVMLYLLHDTNRKLMLKLGEELRPGTRVVSHGFSFPGWIPVQRDDDDLIYLYVAGKFLYGLDETPDVAENPESERLRND